MGILSDFAKALRQAAGQEVTTNTPPPLSPSANAAPPGWELPPGPGDGDRAPPGWELPPVPGDAGTRRGNDPPAMRATATEDFSLTPTNLQYGGDGPLPPPKQEEIQTMGKLRCDRCGGVMLWRCPKCGCESYTPTQRGYELGFWGSFALGYLGIHDLRTQTLAAKGLDRMNERAIQCNCCGRIFGANWRTSTEQALRCKSCGKGHYVVES